MAAALKLDADLWRLELLLGCPSRTSPWRFVVTGAEWSTWLSRFTAGDAAWRWLVPIFEGLFPISQKLLSVHDRCGYFYTFFVSVVQRRVFAQIVWQLFVIHVNFCVWLQNLNHFLLLINRHFQMVIRPISLWTGRLLAVGWWVDSLVDVWDVLLLHFDWREAQVVAAESEWILFVSLESVMHRLVKVQVLCFSNEGTCTNSLVLDFVYRFESSLGSRNLLLMKLKIDSWHIIDFHNVSWVIHISSHSLWVIQRIRASLIV